MYEQIARNNRKSAFLIVLLAAMLFAVGVVIGAAAGLPWWMGGCIAAAIAIVTLTSTYFGGHALVLGVSGARRIGKPDHPQLFNVVEEMSLAAGVPLPAVYIIEEKAPNAFATGRCPERAAVAVTRGLLDKLNREELQGVVAHELAHIKNHDTRFATLLAVLVGSIAMICDYFLCAVDTVFSWTMPFEYDEDRKAVFPFFKLPFILLGLVFAIFAPFFAHALEAAASRRREYLADATAALLTRYPDGLASALQKIDADHSVLRVANRATQHLYIVHPVQGYNRNALALFKTHPPIEDRVERLREMGLRSRCTRGATAPVGEAAAQAFGAAVGLPLAVGAAAAAAIPPPPPLEIPRGRGEEPERRSVELPAGSRPPCPRCQEPLARGRLGEETVLGCRQCGGAWLRAALLEEALHQSPRRLAALDGHLPNLIGYGWDRLSGRLCPACVQPLGPYRLPELPDVWLDRCPYCGGIWFDDGELTAVADVYLQRAGEPSVTAA